MFMKNKTHLTRLFIYPAYFSPENRLKSLGEKEKETGIRMDEKDQNPAILNSGPIQKHLVDLQTRVSSTLQSIQTAAFQLLLLLLLHPYKHREGNRAKIIESLSPSYNLFFFFFFVSMSKVSDEFAKIRDWEETPGAGQSGSLQRIQEHRMARPGLVDRFETWNSSNEYKLNASRGLEIEEEESRTWEGEKEKFFGRRRKKGINLVYLFNSITSLSKKYRERFDDFFLEKFPHFQSMSREYPRSTSRNIFLNKIKHVGQRLESRD